MSVCVENVAPLVIETKESGDIPSSISEQNLLSPGEQVGFIHQEIRVQDERTDAGKSAAGSNSEATALVAQERRSWFPTRWRGRSTAQAAEKSPRIAHVDVDAFFASVEQVLNPHLAGKAVLVGHEAVASASYEAKFHGVKTAMSFRDALRICPKAIVVAGHYAHYADFAERVRRILETYTPAVEAAALDDFYLDFAGTQKRYPDYEATLRRLQAEILGRTGLSVSVGAGRTKVVASIASSLERPRGLCIVAPGMEEAFLAPLPVEKVLGIEYMHAGALAGRGISTIGQLRMVPKPVLMGVFGDVIGKQIWQRARGLDGREVMLSRIPKPVSRETTIEGGTIDTEFLGGLLEYLSERIGSTLREYGKQANTVGLRLRYVDHFSAHQTVRLMRPTNDVHELLVGAKALFAELFRRRVAVRQIGLNVTHLGADRRQHELFATDANRSWFYGKGLQPRERFETKTNGLRLPTLSLSR